MHHLLYFRNPHGKTTVTLDMCTEILAGLVNIIVIRQNWN